MTDARENGRSYGGVSAAERDEQRRRRLLDAGLSTFGTIGFRKATVRGLCREAKVADRNFYELFPTIEDLLLAVYLDCIGRLMTAVVEAITPLPPDADVETMALEGLDAFFAQCEDTALAQTVWLEVLGVSDRLNDAYRNTLKTFGDLLFSKVDDVRNVATTRILMDAAVGGLSYTAMNWHLSGYATERADMVATTTRFLQSLAVLAATD